MNLNSLKQHWLTVAAIAVFVVLLGLILYFQQKARADIRAAEAELEARQGELEDLRRKDPFPSRENLEAIKRDHEQLRALHDVLLASLTKATVPAADLPPIAFSQQLAQRLSRLRQQALQARVIVPEGFAFGFSRYVAALPCSRLPEKECQAVMRQLSKQLAAIEWLAQLLINAPVDEIRAVRRLEVEPGSTSTDALTPDPPPEGERLYDALPFELEFGCEEAVLRKLLNDLARAEWFFVVRRLTTSAGAEAGTQSGRQSGEATTLQTSTGRTRLTVTMRLDLIEVRPASATGREPPE